MLFAGAGKPALTAAGKGNGRLERRQVWVSRELAGYADFPGLSPVVMVHRETEHLAEGRRTGSVQYGVSSLAELEVEQAQGLQRGECQLWRSKALLDVRSQRLCARPSIIFPPVA